jgi:hypothetical protein
MEKFLTNGQDTIYVRPIPADLPDELTGKVAHGGNGMNGSTVTHDPSHILIEHLPRGIGEP